MSVELLHGDLTHDILTAFYEAYSTLGYGYVESVYSAALERELRAAGHAVAREYAVQVIYKGEPLAFQRLDMLVDNLVVVEVKATPGSPPYAERQLMNYLRGTNLEVGLLLHFGPKPRFQRVVAFNGRRDRSFDAQDGSGESHPDRPTDP